MVRSALVLAVFLGLAGCAGGLGTTGSTGIATPVLGGQLQIAPPRGYCLDRLTSRNQRSGAVLIYGTCEGLAEDGPRARIPAVLTASVAPGVGGLGEAGLADLVAFLETSQGRRALARGTSGGSAEILASDLSGGTLVLDARDDTDGKLAPLYWRAVFIQSGALVTVTVSAPAATPIDPAQGQRLVRQFVSSIRAATLAETPRGARAAEQAAPASESEGDAPRGLLGLFNRLP